MINYSLALSRHRILCATHDTQFCLAIQIQRNEQSGTKRRIKRHGTYCKCTNSSAHVANLARGFRSPEHHHEESRRAQYTGRHSTALASLSRAGVPRKDTIEKRRANGGMKESMEGRRKRRRKEGRRSKRKVEEPEASSDPRLPRRTPCHPLSLTPCTIFLALLHQTTQGTLRTSRHPSSFIFLSSLFTSLFSSFDLVSRTSSLFTSRHVSTSYVSPNGVTYFASIVTNAHAIAKLLTFH